MSKASERHLLFVTGRLARHSLQEVVEPLSQKVGFAYTIAVLPITVAALMTPSWIARHLKIPAAGTEIILPGYCRAPLEPLHTRTQLPVQIGPKDLYDLPQFLGTAAQPRDGYGAYSIEIVAEINHAPDVPLRELIRLAQAYQADGADVIDLGCNPGQSWQDVGLAVRELRQRGLRVSIDSFEPMETQRAVAAGAELVLSVNSSNVAAALDWDCELVVIPDDPASMAGLQATAQRLLEAGKRIRLDPILEPIGCGFVASLQRYIDVRRQFPRLPLLMGVGNLTELTECDSAGINLMLLAICAELDIRSVLTTQVIPWAQTSIRELAAARQLVHFAVTHGTVPKHLDPRLVMLRDGRVHWPSTETLEQLASELRDPNYRIFVQPETIHLLAAGIHLHSADPYALLGQLLERQPANLDLTHAFYLGYELAKAKTALTLGKQYRQDEALQWGMLTEPEPTHPHRRRLAVERRRAAGANQPATPSDHDRAADENS